MAQPQPEKRTTRRFSLDLPISVKFLDNGNGQRELAGHTRDVSSRGVFMYLDTDITAGAPIEFVMTLPPEITLAEPIRVRCMGKILRVDKVAQGQGVAGYGYQALTGTSQLNNGAGVFARASGANAEHSSMNTGG